MNLLKPFRKLRETGSHPQAHMTWASRSVSHAASRTGEFFKKQLWVWPIVAVFVLSIIGFTVRSKIESTIKTNLRSALETLLDVEVAMLENWFEVQKSNAQTLANNLEFRQSVETVLEGLEAEPAPLVDSNMHRGLEKQLGAFMSSHDYVGFFVTDKSRHIISSSRPDLIGQQDIPEFDSFLARALEGETVISPPFQSIAALKADDGRTRVGEPTMYVCAPIRNVEFQVVGVLALQIRPEQEFTRIMQRGRIGASGETYAFDREGVLVSNSRFDEDLILLGLLPDEEHSRSILNVLVRDPGGDMTAGYRPQHRRRQLPLTRMADDAIAGNSNVDVEGYRDYRGVLVVGAWTWMPAYQIGVATEVDVSQAFRPLTILQRTFWTLYGLLILSSVAIFVFTLIVSRLRREAQKAAIETQQIGQYVLDEKVGVGAMGVVYRGHHAMLRRPTAIKLLSVEKVNDHSIQRFEREVQVTCQLNHPNTIAIYDYGRTAEGVFYYAMEYLDGIDLQALVEQYGPQSEQRVVHILQQICGSLHEAHSLGLVHRDIKPANVMINRRGCVPDFVKVMDFGLVKAVDEEKQFKLTAANTLTGTPLYMSPEAIEAPMSVDARSDIYSLSALGYFLLTGQPVFSASNLVELCQRHVDETPVPPSERVSRSISPELEHALLTGLEKTRTKRPQTARELASLLAKCPASTEWRLSEADAWWSRHESGRGNSSLPSATQSTENYAQTVISDSETLSQQVAEDLGSTYE